MSWAARRRFIILLIIGAVIAAFLSIILIATLYKTPSCTDGVQNQNEAGVDCGGSCAYLCSDQTQPPTVLFTHVLRTSAGRTDVIALVENKNATAAAKDVPYRITLYSDTQAFIQEVTGVLDLPPGATVPVYIPGIALGKQTATQAFLTVHASAPRWVTFTANSLVAPTVVDTTSGGTASEPRIEAILANMGTVPLTDVSVVVLVYDARKNVIAASKTVVPVIPGQGKTVAIFTWREAFSETPALIEVVPIIPLPAWEDLP